MVHIPFPSFSGPNLYTGALSIESPTRAVSYVAGQFPSNNATNAKKSCIAAKTVGSPTTMSTKLFAIPGYLKRSSGHRSLELAASLYSKSANPLSAVSGFQSANQTWPNSRFPTFAIAECRLQDSMALIGPVTSIVGRIIPSATDLLTMCPFSSGSATTLWTSGFSSQTQLRRNSFPRRRTLRKGLFGLGL